jgi:two-component system, cell cycle response regulator CtrA
MRVLLAASPAVIDENRLRAANLVVETADTGQDALDLVRHYDFDIVVLDLEMDGYEVLLRMRDGGVGVPVLIVSNASRPEANVRALRLGADDCIATPFDWTELLARMQAIVRRSRGVSQAKAAVGPLQLNLNSREVTVNGQVLALTGKEYAILEVLVLRKGMVLTKDVLMNHLYAGLDEPEQKIIDVFICKLRRKLALAGCDEIIGTVWGRGYIVRDPVAAPAAREDARFTAQTNCLVA